MEQEVEIWKPVKDYENLYEVSNHGRVRSLNYNRTGEVKVLRPVSNKAGYLYVFLCRDGKCKHHAVHRLVGQHFIPNPQDLPVINHLDEVKQNNHVSNLQWTTQKENNEYSCCADKAHTALMKPVLQFTKDGVLVGEFKSIAEAGRQTGANHNLISSCCLGKSHNKSAGGFIWRFK